MKNLIPTRQQYTENIYLIELLSNFIYIEIIFQYTENFTSIASYKPFSGNTSVWTNLFIM